MLSPPTASKTLGLISPEEISCCSPSEGPAWPEYLKPVALVNAGATIFSFRYKREAAYATFAVPEGLAAAEGARHTIPSNAPNRAPLFAVKKIILQDSQRYLRRARRPDVRWAPLTSP